MLFNSPEFLLFLPIVFGLYWFVVQRNLRAQNVLLVIASYVFYGWWDWRFLGLIAFSTLVDYLVGLQIKGAHNSKNKTTIFVNPPVLHQNHLNELRNQLKSSISSPWLDANTNHHFKDSTLFFDDHHLNDDGATHYTHWIKSNFALH